MKGKKLAWWKLAPGLCQHGKPFSDYCRRCGA